MNFIDLFSGIGGFRSALEKNGHKCIAYSEIDKYAKQSYQAMYDTKDEIDLGDITRISEEYLSHFKEKNDIVVGGSPCQSFSLAGSRKGFEDTRGTLFFEYAKVVKETQPKYFLFENVKGMLSHDKGNTIRVVLETFNQLGYYIDFNIFNSKYYDVPQNRERIYIVGKRKDLVDSPKYQEKVKGKKKLEEVHNWAVDNINYVKLLPKLKTEVTTRLIDVLEKDVDEKYYLSEEKTKKLTLDHDLGGKLNMYNYNERDRVHSVNKVSTTLNTMQGGDRQPKIAVKGFKEIVKVRKYDVNKTELSELLRISKQDVGISNKEISESLNIPITKVEHWFRTDKSFAIPEANVWFELKKILNITNIEHDEAITTFVNKESNFDTTNRIYDVGYLSPTLNTTSEPKIAIREATKQGYAIAEQGDSVNVSYPTSTTRRGRVGKQLANTLQAGETNQGVVIGGDFDDKKIEKDTFKILQTLQKEIGEKEIAEWRSRILDTFQQEEILRQDVYEKGLDIEQNKEKLERNQQSHECEVKNTTFDKQERMREMPINKEFRCSSHGREPIQQFARELTSIMQKLSHETSQEKNLYRLQETTQGIRLLQQALYKIQEIWGSSLHEKQGVRIRKLTEKECWRLQGFSDEQFYKAKDSGVSNSQLYKQAGNSVTVNVVDAIVKELD